MFRCSHIASESKNSGGGDRFDPAINICSVFRNNEGWIILSHNGRDGRSNRQPGHIDLAFRKRAEDLWTCFNRCASS